MFVSALLILVVLLFVVLLLRRHSESSIVYKEYPKSRAVYLPAFKKALQALDGLTFHSLRRPDDPEPVHATRELVDWGVRIYCFSLLSHFREMLRSFLLLVENGNIPAAFVVARCLFEMGAHGYYVHKHVIQHLEAGDFNTAFRFLAEVNIGSRYMQEKHGEQREEENKPPFLAPRDVAKAVRCFDEWGNIKKAVETYSFLSEFSHPNMGAFSHYYTMERDEQKFTWVRYSAPPRDPLMAPMPEVSVSLTSVLHFGQKLLDETGETKLAACLRVILSEHAGMTL